MYTAGTLYGVVLGVLGASVGGWWGIGLLLLGILGTLPFLYYDLKTKKETI